MSKIQKDKVPDATKVDKITAHDNCIKCYLKTEIQYNCHTSFITLFFFKGVGSGIYIFLKKNFDF